MSVRALKPGIRRLLVGVSVVAALLGAWGAQAWHPESRHPAAAEAQAAGASAVGLGRADVAALPGVQTLDFDWTDASRGRAVPVRLYWPESASAGAPVPLVVFSHGIGGSRRGYSYLGAFWASQGIAALHVQHVGSDRSLWSGNPLQLVGRLQGAAQEDEALNRVRDVRFALDQVLAGDHGALIRRDAIIAAGHSYGANTTLLLAGAQVQRQGQALDLAEPRLRAAIVISAPPFYGEPDPQRILAGVRVPTLHVTATEDVIRIPGYYSPASDRLQVFEATGGPSKALAVFKGGSHSMFTDRLGTGGADWNPQVKAATRELALNFLRSVFEGAPTAFERTAARHASLLARLEYRY